MNELGPVVLSFVLVPIWFLAAGLWVYGVYSYLQALRHRAPGVSRSHVMLWNDDQLSGRGIAYRRRGTKALLRFVALIASTMLIASIVYAE